MKRVRNRKITQEKSRRAVRHRRDLYEKVLNDMDTFIRQREYGRASELLLSTISNGIMTVNEIWRPLIALIQQQGRTADVGIFLDMIVSETKSRPPFIAEMERIFHSLLCGSEDAYTIAFTFVNDEGGKLAIAQGFLGIIITCLREVELYQVYGEKRNMAEHVFEHSEFANFVLTKQEEWQTTRYNLNNAEYHLRQARILDEEDDFFVAFHAQVLIALDRMEEAIEILEACYKRNKSIHVLRMLMSIDRKKADDQANRMLEYLELDPYAAEQEFCNTIEGVFESKKPAEYLERVLEIIVDRIERGDQEEHHKWRLLAIAVSYLRENGEQDIIEAVMGLRMEWWSTTYFRVHNFQRAPISERIVYMAVCAQQLLDLEHGHPVYGILSGDLSDNLAQFVNENIRII